MNTNLRAKSTQYLVGFRDGVGAAVGWHHKASQEHGHIADLHEVNGDPLAKHHRDMAEEHLMYAGHLRRLRREASEEIERRIDDEEAARRRADADQFGLGA